MQGHGFENLESPLGLEIVNKLGRGETLLRAVEVVVEAMIIAEAGRVVETVAKGIFRLEPRSCYYVASHQR